MVMPWFAWVHRLAQSSHPVLVTRVYFELAISAPTKECPAGFLFLCPETDFKTGPSSFSWPECPAYWSLDPLGVEHLSTEKAANLGFPSLQYSTRIMGRCWDASVYDGIRRFHEAHDFAPGTQDVARHLGFSLYQLTSEFFEAPFAYVDGVVDDGDEDHMDLSW
ncbi:hypothetical protein DFH06DRAFT_509461 [Mycena polygramma]|nr:hypothetical protein DFH06DRAFT_509461 [Mycena polygramma]